MEHDDYDKNDSQMTEQLIEYERKPEDKYILFDEEFKLLKKDMKTKQKKGTFESETEFIDYYQMKKWQILSCYCEDSMISRFHRSKFMKKLYKTIRYDIIRIMNDYVNGGSPSTKEKYKSNVVIWEDQMKKVFVHICKWNFSEFSLLYGTSKRYANFVNNASDGKLDDIVEEKECFKRENLCFWICYNYLFFVLGAKKWLFCQTKGKDLKTLFYLFSYSEDGGCLLSHNIPIIRYSQSIFIQSCELLYRYLPELVYNKDIKDYVEVLKIRFSMLSMTKFPEGYQKDTFDMEGMYEKGPDQKYQVSMAFIHKSLETLQNIDRTICHYEYTCNSLGISDKAGILYNALIISENRAIKSIESVLKELKDTSVSKVCLEIPSEVYGNMLFQVFQNWCKTYLSGYRQNYIIPRFRQQIYNEWVRPGEYLAFIDRWPLKEANGRNIVSSIRPGDIDRLHPIVLTKKPDEVILNNKNCVGMIQSKNLASCLMIEYFFTENTSNSINWTNVYKGYIESDVESIRKEAIGEPCIIKTFCGYLVYCPWIDLSYLGISKKKSRNYIPKGTVYNFLRFHEAYHFWCMRILQDYKKIAAFSIKKYKHSNTKTPKKLARRFFEFYMIARTSILRLFRGFGITHLRFNYEEKKEITEEVPLLWTKLFETFPPFKFDVARQDYKKPLNIAQYYKNQKEKLSKYE